MDKEYSNDKRQESLQFSHQTLGVKSSMEGMMMEEIAALGLDSTDIKLHQRRLKETLQGKLDTSLPVADTCRIDNGGIISQKNIQCRKVLDEISPHGFVAMVPAAGAASRFFAIASDFISALTDGNSTQLELEITKLNDLGALEWALPDLLKTVLESKEPVKNAMKFQNELLEQLLRPKALQPAVTSGESFLFFKNIEHQLICGIDGQVYIVPFEQRELFKQEFERLDPSSSSCKDWLDQTHFIEQGPSLSTIRFKGDGSPYRDADGKLSVVPAGHGTLVKLIPQIKQKFPNAHSVFIRNIDNISGTGSQAVKASQDFLTLHQWLLSRISEIRELLNTQNSILANKVAAELCYDLGIDEQAPDYQDWLKSQPEQYRHLWLVLIRVFHTFPEFCETIYSAEQSWHNVLVTLFNRPLNCLGQVPNSGKDIGGTPVFTHARGTKLAICLELPHASKTDIDMFLSNPDKATHFNPVFVTSELVEDHSIYSRESSSFWILVQKIHDQTPVMYHETVLYELLGNSMLANTVFIEIPRLLFNPHKSVSDSQSRHRSDWLGTDV